MILNLGRVRLNVVDNHVESVCGSVQWVGVSFQTSVVADNGAVSQFHMRFTASYREMLRCVHDSSLLQS